MTDLTLVHRHRNKGSKQTPPKDTSPFKTTAIGSCRVVGPLRYLEAAKKLKLDQSGVYGYSHSSGEVRLHLSHVLEATQPPKHLMPVLAPTAATTTQSSKNRQPVDFFVFEFSSAKEISIDGHPVQLNYFNRHFKTFLSDVDRARAFWTHAKRRKPTQMHDFLKGIAEYQKLPETSQQLLRSTELEMTSLNRLARDIEAIRLAASDHLIVTHFDAITLDGSPLFGRSEYLKLLRRALREVGANWFDPTGSVAEFGQSQALDTTNNSLSHFSPAFEKHLGDIWWEGHIKPFCVERRLDADLRRRIRATADEKTREMQTAN